MWLTVQKPIVIIQNSTVPNYPPGKNVRTKIYPIVSINIYIGLKNPHIGHMASVKNVGIKSPAIVITGMS